MLLLIIEANFFIFFEKYITAFTLTQQIRIVVQQKKSLKPFIHKYFTDFYFAVVVDNRSEKNFYFLKNISQHLYLHSKYESLYNKKNR
jgi:hypothetical protein